MPIGVISLAILAAFASVAATATPVEPVLGRYCGTIESSGVFAKAVTRLHLEPDGALGGDYSFKDPDGETVSGLLSGTPDERRGIKTLQWTDRYGTGLLQIRFASDFASFEGRWSPQGRPPQYIWRGAHCDDLQS